MYCSAKECERVKDLVPSLTVEKLHDVTETLNMIALVVPRRRVDAAGVTEALRLWGTPEQARTWSATLAYVDAALPASVPSPNSAA